MSPDLISRQTLDAVLRANLPGFGIACITLLAGISSLLLARLGLRDRLLLWVGIFSLLYSTRLFVENELIRDAFDAPGSGYLPWAHGITYLINIPFALFARELFGPGWKGSIRFWLWVEVAFAIVAIPPTLLGHELYWTDLANSILVVIGTLLILVHVVLRRRDANLLAASLTWPLVIFGIFVVLENNRVRPAGFDIEPLGFLVLLAGLAWTAVRRALASERKLIDVERELATARRIQSSIIPQSCPTVSGLRVAARYQPMTSVAGDFFDFLKPGTHRLTILVADVSGHGVPAALVASTLKVCFAAQQEHANDPAEILAGLNTMLRGSLGGQYLTAACAAIDIEARSIKYSGAGHPPSLLLRTAQGELAELAENGLFIGPFPHSTYSNVSVPFSSGDRLLLYTDGVVEACGADGQEFGRERLGRFLLTSNHQEPAQVLEHLFQAISNGPQQDDLTVVLAEFD